MCSQAYSLGLSRKVTVNSRPNSSSTRRDLLTRPLRRKSSFVLLAAAAGLGAGYLVLFQSAAPLDKPIPFPPPPIRNGFELVSVLPPDAIQAILDPVLISAEVVAPEMNSDERVIGIVINGDARAYPVTVLSAHEIVNDVVGGEPVAITWCPLCYTAVAFSRRLEGSDQAMVFGVSGKLLHNTLVMYDQQSKSLWSQLYGAGVEGPLVGSTLGFFPSVHTEWEIWRGQFPDTLVLSKQQTCVGSDCNDYAVDRYASYYQSSAEGLIDWQIPRESESRGPKQFVLGVVARGSARAYPFELLAETTLINDQINDTPILIWFDPSSETGSAFDRRQDDRILSFFQDPDQAGILMDRETHSQWQAMTGESIAGELSGTRLVPLIATVAFEFAWLAYYPDSTAYQP